MTYLTSSIMRGFIASSVLFLSLQSCSAVRFTRSMAHPAASMRKYIHPWKYLPFAKMPRSMQRRFMWREMDDTVDELMGGVASGARAMTHMFTPSMVRYRNPIDYDTQSSTKVKYVIKKPPPPFKRLKVVKFRAPKKPIPMYSAPIVDIPTVSASYPISKPNIIVPFMSEEELRKIEKEQEKRVESEHDGDFHHHSHQSHMDADLITGRINEFGEGWLPIQTPFSTPKPFAVSKLHTKVEATTTEVPPSSLPIIRPEPTTDNHRYEVTEHSVAESIQNEHTFQPSNHFEVLGTTADVPNYPEYFLKTMQKSDEQFKPMRVRIPVTTTLATTTTSNSVTLSNRLPPRSTTERPFNRYNLHRPKSTKFFFSRPTSSPDSTKKTHVATTTEQTTKTVPELPPVIQEVIRTTRETIKTTREPVKTTRAPKKPPPEKVRTTRNDSEVKSKLKIKNSSQNESSKNILAKTRGRVRFGEKQS